MTTLTETDGHITLIGTAARSANDIALSHYDEFGQLDPRYGNNGNVVISGEVLSRQTLGTHGNAKFIQAVALEDNSILLVSNVFSNGSKITVLKLDHLGAIDRSYGVNGLAEVDTTASRFFGSDALLDSQNRLVITSSSAMSIIRLNQDGSMDESFGDSGIARQPSFPDGISGSGAVSFGTAKITLDSQDRIVFIGNRTVFISDPIQIQSGTVVYVGSYIMRLDVSGAPDQTLDGDGLQLFDDLRFGSDQDLVNVPILGLPFSAALDNNDNLIIGVSNSGEDRGAVSLSSFKLG